MKLEQQVCSLELAKKLKELGVKQESLFNWLEGCVTKNSIIVLKGVTARGDLNITNSNAFSAFTVAELGEMLPNTISIKGEQCSIEITNIYEVIYRALSLEKRRITVEANTEADARAKMLIYLLENKLITN